MENANFIPNTNHDLESVLVTINTEREGPIIETSRIVGWRITEDALLDPVTAKWGVPGDGYTHCEARYAAMMLIRDKATGEMWDVDQCNDFTNIEQCVAYLHQAMAQKAAEQSAQPTK